MGTEPGSDGWCCAQCAELSPPSFDVCWNCGTTCGGSPDPTFLRGLSDPETGEPVWSTPQWSLSGLFWWTSACALFLGAIRYLPAELVVAGLGLLFVCAPLGRFVVKSVTKWISGANPPRET